MPYTDHQVSYMVDLGLPNDADETQCDVFVRGMNDFERAEFERVSDPVAPSPQSTPSDDPIVRDEIDDEPNGPAPIQRDPTPSPEDDQPITRAELARIEQQRTTDRQARHDAIARLQGDDVSRDVIERAYREDWPVERIAREFLESSRSQRPAAVDRAPAGHTRSAATHNTLQALQGGMLLRQGIDLDNQIFRNAGASAMLRRENVGATWLTRLNAAGTNVRRSEGTELDNFERARDESHRYANFSMFDFCREALTLAGRRMPEDRDDLIRSALSTAQLEAVFSTSVNMLILQAYMGIEDTTKGWCFETDVANFKKNERGRLTKGSGVKKLARGGKPTDITFSDETEEYAIARYAGKFIIDEQDIIDDTFGATSDHTTRELGELLAEIRPNLIYALLLSNPTMRDGVALFHADHGNLTASSAWGSDTYRAAKKKMVTQTENGRNIRNSLRHVIAPEELNFAVSQLLASVELRRDGGGDGSLQGTANPHRGTADPHFDPRLDTGVTDPDTGTAYAGSSSTWYGAAENGRNGIEVGYRRGTGRAPRMESFRLSGDDAYGMGWKGNLDIGVKAIDWRGLIKNVA
ncbi:hypothetical protein K227x_64330 [Rubripirellula lacrimiformis]|uniref:Uncharacterized protein n=1 Tax=Rubripirellula lacrimiformis TaxID=1930273 RepID=A0A517NLQ8_9BACT|nr:hypothetical protein [Rubripirellula lacrimiformis]QDT08003.1 hypothetical protein K227x_64330 [Rubripirellula lacrimiformis]